MQIAVLNDWQQALLSFVVALCFLTLRGHITFRSAMLALAVQAVLCASCTVGFLELLCIHA